MPLRAGRYPQKIAHRAEPLGKLPAGRFTAVCVDSTDTVWAISDDGLWRGGLEGFQRLPLPEGVEAGQVAGICAVPGEEEKLLITLRDGPALEATLEDLRWQPSPTPPLPDIVVGGVNLSELQRRGEAHVLLWVHKGGWLVNLRGEIVLMAEDGHIEPLPRDFGRPPLRSFTRAAVSADGSWWFASPEGACHLHDGHWEYFAGKRYLNSDKVNDIAVDSQGRAWLATEEGLCCIEYRPMTLAEKAQHFEAITRSRHVRDGYVCENRLAEPGAVDQYTHHAADNDGLWTSLYVAAEAFRYGATGSEEAKAFATESVLALCGLEHVTPVPGLVARARVPMDMVDSVDLSGGEWHESEDGKWLWKGDVSSDELDGHFFAYAVYFDLVDHETARQTVRQTVERIMDHLIEHDFAMIDVDGEPTTWAFFSPSWLNNTREDQRGLNSLEILCYLRVAHHICGKDEYMKHYWRLVEEHRYALNTVNQKICWPGDVNFSDDELAFCSYYPLLRYEDDAALRQLYMLSMRRNYEALRNTRNPLWICLYNAFSPDERDLCDLAQTLAELPLDLVTWAMRNSHRADVDIDDRFSAIGELMTREIVPYDERGNFRWNHNPFRPDSGGDGRTEHEGTHYLLPYWMARYHGLIEEAES